MPLALASGAVSEPPYTSLNLGLGSGDDRARVHGNRARFGRSIGIDPREIVTLRQVHGNPVIVLTEASRSQLMRGTPGDGLITNRPHLPLAVSLPIASPSSLPLQVCLPWVLCTQGERGRPCESYPQPSS
jgi:copper oxidase (laccase) domain-containing protein